MEKSKKEFRLHYKALRSKLTASELEERSLKITQNVIKFLGERKELKHFHIFFPIKFQREVDTFLIYDFLKSEGATVFTSKIDPTSNHLQTLQLLPETTFHLDSWGIPIPEKFSIARNESIEAVFVPLLVFDEKGKRIGFGKGYYDVFLKDLSPEVLKIGLSYFLPELEIPAEQHDIPLDFCITPNSIFEF